VIATADLPAGSFVELAADQLRKLQRDLVLAWNPRSVSVRPEAAKLAEQLAKALKVA